MQKYYLIGSPISHSLSPAMHNLSFRTLEIDAEYGLRETGLDMLAETVAELKSEGAAGWNVTMPCKRAMCDFCDELSPEALISRSVNTVRNRKIIRLFDRRRRFPPDCIRIRISCQIRCHNTSRYRRSCNFHTYFLCA